MGIVILAALHHAAAVQVLAAVHTPVADDKIFLTAISLNYNRLNLNKLNFLGLFSFFSFLSLLI